MGLEPIVQTLTILQFARHDNRNDRKLRRRWKACGKCSCDQIAADDRQPDRQPGPVRSRARDHHRAWRGGVPLAPHLAKQTDPDQVSLAMTICRTIGLVSVAFSVAIDGPAAAEGIVVYDARNRDVVIENPARIVSIGGAVTEILYALGFDDRIAGVDATSLYPPAALRDKPNVGYM